jgi:hypothetical protein
MNLWDSHGEFATKKKKTSLNHEILCLLHTSLMFKIFHFYVLNFYFVLITILLLDIRIKWDHKNDKNIFISLKFCTTLLRFNIKS